MLQRVIAAHAGVATVSEPWLLLPYLYSLRSRGIVAEYTHPLMVAALEDFCAELPAGSDDYDAELRRFVLRLYAKAGGADAEFFLDKSPPYYFVAEDIMRLFPEGKFVFLWRDPLSIVASIIQTWQGGRWHPLAFREDLFIGLPRLVSAYTRNSEKSHAVRFEDLVNGDERVWQGVMDYIGIDFEPMALDGFSDIRLKGRMGDQVGTRRYAALSSEPTQKWTKTINNPLRRAWCERYLRFLGDRRLVTMGYDPDELRRALSGRPRQATSLLGDLSRLIEDLAREPLHAHLRRRGLGGPSVLGELRRHWR